MVNEVGSILSFPVATPRASTSTPIGLVSGGGVGGGQPAELGSGSGVKAVVSALHAQIRLAKDAMAEAALQIRFVHSSLEKADEALSQVIVNLTQIVKQYPPFAQDSPQRIAYLNSVTGLRKQLEALAFPVERGQGGLGSAPGQSLGWLPPQPVFPTQGDLSIPELSPETATDSDVANALSAVADTRERVSLMKQGMWDEVARLVGSLDINRAISQAGEVNSYVASTPGHGISVASEQLMANTI